MAVTRLFRLVVLLIGLLAYGMDGAQARITTSSDGTYLIPMCSIYGTQFVELHLGEDGPTELSGGDCGQCMVGQGIKVDTPSLPVPLLFFLLSPNDILRSVALHIYSIWPGAPPIGPPVLSG